VLSFILSLDYLCCTGEARRAREVGISFIFTWFLFIVILIQSFHVSIWLQTNNFICKRHGPYLRVYEPHFFDKNFPSKIGLRLMHGILSFWRLSPRRRYYMLWNSHCWPLVFETVILKVIAHARMHQRIYYRCIGMFWLHESSRRHRFPEVGRPWHYCQIIVNAAGDNQSATNSIANILLSHR
jgi:hypothetical protein